MGWFPDESTIGQGPGPAPEPQAPAPMAAGIPNAPTGGPDIGSQWTTWLANPGNRSLLAQMGTMLMQPTGLGQSFGGKVGQAIGGGMAAKTRYEQLAEKRLQDRAQLDQKNRSLQIDQQQADAQTQNANTSQVATQNRVLSDASTLAVLQQQARASNSFTDFFQKILANSIDPAKDMADPAFLAKAQEAWKTTQQVGAASGPAPNLAGAIGSRAEDRYPVGSIGTRAGGGKIIKQQDGTWVPYNPGSVSPPM